MQRDPSLLILCQRVRGSARTVRAVQNTRVFQTETRVVADVKVFARPILSATRAPGISVSQTHFLTIKHVAQTWCSRNFVLGRPGIEH
jgi:hypothetical protein